MGGWSAGKKRPPASRPCSPKTCLPASASHASSVSQRREDAMASSVFAIAQLPWEMTTPSMAQTIITVVLAVVVAAFVIAALADWRRSGSPAFLLMLVGGYVCSFNEATVDVLGHCFVPVDGVIAYTAFGRAVPLWVVLAYVV